MVSTVFISLPTGPPSLVSGPPVPSSGGHEGPGITGVVLLESAVVLMDDVVALMDGVVAPIDGVLAPVEGVVALVDGVDAGNAISEDCVHTDCLYVCVCASVSVLCV